MFPLHSFDRSRRRAVLVALAASLAAPPIAHAAGASDGPSLTLDAARAEHEAGRAILIDIREPPELATGVAAGARLIPLSQFGRRLAEVPSDADTPVLLICNSQNRSSAVYRALRERGFSNIRYVEGGMSEWARRGWPLVRPGG